MIKSASILTFKVAVAAFYGVMSYVGVLHTFLPNHPPIYPSRPQRQQQPQLQPQQQPQQRSQRYHPASDAAAIALHERYLSITGTAKPPANEHSIQEMQVGQGPVMRTEMHLSQPDRMLVRTTMADKLVMEFGYDGTTGWSNSPMAGLTRLTESALKEMRSATTGMGTPVIDSTTRLLTMGRVRFDDQPVDGIRMLTAAGDTAEAYYAVSSGLMIGLRMWRAGLVGTGSRVDTLQILFQDYRQVDGRLTYFTNSMRGMGMAMTSKTVLLEYAPIDPVKFKPPAGLREPPAHP